MLKQHGSNIEQPIRKKNTGGNIDGKKKRRRRRTFTRIAEVDGPSIEFAMAEPVMLCVTSFSRDMNT